jgi:hypothetical protein
MPRTFPAVLVLLAALAAPAAARELPVNREHLLDTRIQTTAPAAPAHVRAARAGFLRGLGPSGFLSLDRVDGGVRFMGRTDGYLSGPAAGTPREVALRWAREHVDVLGIEEADVRSLRLASEYTGPLGVTRLIFEQTYRGIPAFDDGLRINVARDGRIVNVGGSPKAGVRVPSVRPGIGAAEAILAGARTVGPANLDLRRTRHRAELAIVSTGRRTARLAWRVAFESASDAAWTMLVDAQNGSVILRANRVKWASGLAWDFYPGAPKGGEPRSVDFSPWLTGPDRLRGNNTHVYNDADGTEDFHTDIVDPTQPTMGDIVTPNEEIRPKGITSGDWDYAYTPVPSPAGYCPKAGCAWNHLVNGSWLLNRDQDGTQVFFFVNRFHDHLLAPPISFTEAAGNFQFENSTGQGKAGDGIYASNMDAAGQVAGRPIPLLWSDNANMLTRPDGEAPRMQMFLFEPIDALGYPFSDVSGGSDGTVVYHEYTHGLTNRLVVDAKGEGALNSAQSGAMGEAWSDFYAMDFMIKQGLLEDTEKPGEVKVGIFVDGGQDLVRTEAIDCTLGAPADVCPRKRSPLAGEEGGGYTYEHFGRVVGSPEVHGDGEIWAQTLMDLRRRFVKDHGEAVGSERAELYVTRALELSPDEPSFLDMRNAILQADLVAGKRDQRRIWEVFAARGMGFSAKTLDGKDTNPEAAFDLPANLPPADMLAPAVTVDTPGEDGVVRAENAIFAGTAVDDAGIVALSVDGTPAKLTGSTWTAALKLPGGRRTVTVVARDGEGRQGTARRTVRVDVAAPTLKVRPLRRRHGLVLVSGTVRDDVGATKVRVGSKTVRVAGGRFFAAVKPPRRGRLSVVAIDRAGRTASKRLRVR